MVTREIPSAVSPSELMAFELAILEDARAQSDRYWTNWLWGRSQPQFSPSSILFASLPQRDACRIESVWLSWFTLLTSFEFASVLIGRDLQTMLGDYGMSCRKQ